MCRKRGKSVFLSYCIYFIVHHPSFTLLATKYKYIPYFCNFAPSKLITKGMIELTQEELKQHFSEPIFGQIAETADALGLECYVVGGYVRDIFLQRPSKDIDVVVVGSGIAMAEALGNVWDVVLMSLFSRISERHK